jgi:hypothetical protein
MATDVPVDKGISLQDWGAIAGIASAVLAAIALFVVLNSKRSVILQVGNQTDQPLKLISTHHVHGDFLQQPDDIPPNTVSVFSSGSVGGSVVTGTEGSCSYLSSDGVQFDIFWDNPAFGSNSTDMKYAGDNAARFRIQHLTSGGNENAQMRYQIGERVLADFRSQPYTGNPVLIQSRFAADSGHGNFELLVPLANGGLAAYFRENNAPGLPWETSAIFGQSAGRVDAVSMIQSNFGDPGNLEVVARVGDTLQFFFRDSGPQFIWSGPFGLIADNRPIRGVTGTPQLIQSRNGHQGNFELLVPLAAGGLAHFFRDNDGQGLPWHGPTVVLSPDRHFDAAAMIESSFGDGHNLEVVAQSGQELIFFFRTFTGTDFPWNGPFPFRPDGFNDGFIGGGGNLALIQSRFGSAGINFELAGIEATFTGPGALWHAFRDNDAPDKPWHFTTRIDQAPGVQAAALTMIESNFGSPGNLEMITRLMSGGLAFFFRDSVKWNGPFVM